MKKQTVLLVIGFFAASFAHAATDPNKNILDNYPWCNKYPISFFTKTRTAKTVPQGRTLVSLKIQHFEADQKTDSGGILRKMPSGYGKEWVKLVATFKHGVTDDLQLGIGIPFMHNNFDMGSKHNNSKGLTNIFTFAKWRFVKETNNFPAMAIDFWYYWPTGDADRSLGKDQGWYKLTGEISKAWKDFSLHLNPGVTWSENDDDDSCELNAAILFKTFKTVWPAIEYNYLNHETKDVSHDLIPGVIWKFGKCSSFKMGVVINLDTDSSYRDRCGLIFKVSHLF